MNSVPRPPMLRFIVNTLRVLVQLGLPVLLGVLAVRLTQMSPLSHALLVVTLTYLGICAGQVLGRIVGPSLDVLDIAVAASVSPGRVRASWETRLADLACALNKRGLIGEGVALARLITSYQDYQPPDHDDIDLITGLEDKLNNDSSWRSDLVVLLVVLHDRVLHDRTALEAP